MSSSVAEQLPATRDTTLAVLHVFAFFRPDFTGEGIYFERLSKYLSHLGIRSDVAVERTRANGPAPSIKSIGKIYYFGSTPPKQRLLRVRMTLWFLTNLYRYDVVHFHSHVGRLFQFHLIGKLFGCRVVQSCTLNDGLEQIVMGYKPAHRSIIRRLCQLIDATITISPKLESQSIKILPRSRVHLVPQGTIVPTISKDDKIKLRESWGISQNEIVLLCIASICERKDIQFLVRNHVGRSTQNQPIRLLLIGPVLENEYADSLRDFIKTLPFRDSITIFGFLEDPSPAYRIADAFVFASREEGFGNVLLEAMSHGLPVVSRRLPGVTDYFIDHKRNGFLFDTAEEYCAFVRELIESPEIRQVIGQAARNTVVSNFTLAAIAERYVKIYARNN